jgi:hypothetical protein
MRSSGAEQGPERGLAMEADGRGGGRSSPAAAAGHGGRRPGRAAAAAARRGANLLLRYHVRNRQGPKATTYSYMYM